MEGFKRSREEMEGSETGYLFSASLRKRAERIASIDSWNARPASEFLLIYCKQHPI